MDYVIISLAIFSNEKHEENLVHVDVLLHI